MLEPPYNKFFKVGVSSSGNHDNNIYNNSWAERYHGLKEVEVKAKAKSGDKKSGDKKTGGKKTGDKKTGKGKITEAQSKKESDGKNGQDTQDKKSDKKKTRFEIHIPTTWELAANLEGKLLLIHGDMDNNVHPAGTLRLVDALIKAKKRFDMLIIPGARHGYGAASEYVKQRTWEYFAQHLLGDYQTGADIMDKTGRKRR
jgi:dipeptidyl-peptidase-4